MRSCALCKKGSLQKEFMAKLYFIDWETMEHIKHSISLQSRNSQV
jgi:hypothetical protein